MKSSTIRRSTLSKETMEVIENLSKEQDESGLPGEYVRPDEIEESVNSSNNNGMSQEIDLLWQNFKTNQFNTNSPIVHLFVGILIGIVLTSAVFVIHSMVIKDSTNSGKSPVLGIENIFKSKEKVEEPTLEQQANIQQNIPADSDVNSVDNAVKENTETPVAETSETEATASNNVDTSSMTKYKVKSGDTIESIIKQHYGTYSPDKAEQIMKVNNMPSLDRINIDQEILLP